MSSCITIKPQYVKQFTKSKKLKSLIDYLNTVKDKEKEPFFNPEETTLCFDLMDDNFKQLSCVSFKTQLPEAVRILSKLYNIPEFTCSKDGKDIFYKNIKLKGYEFYGSQLTLFAEEQFNHEIENFGTVYPKLSVKIDGERVKIASKLTNTDFFFKDKKILFVKTFDLDKKYSKLIREVCEEDIENSVSGSYDEMRSFLSKEKKDLLDFINKFDDADEIQNYEYELIGRYDCSSYKFEFSKYIAKENIPIILNELDGSENFKSSPDGKHLYFNKCEIIEDEGLIRDDGDKYILTDQGVYNLPREMREELKTKQYTNSEIYDLMKKYKIDFGFAFKDDKIYEECEDIISDVFVYKVTEDGNLQLAEKDYICMTDADISFTIKNR